MVETHRKADRAQSDIKHIVIMKSLSSTSNEVKYLLFA